jgi:Flp pilus assembly secretin CpaC
MMNLNYSWIGNLGVVPLFLLAAFLFLPDLAFLFFLLILVTCVFELIIFSSLKFKVYFQSSIFLATWKPYVKAILATLVIFSQCKSYALASRAHILGRGEQKTIYQGQMSHYSVGNKEVISVKYLKSDKSFYVKGKSVGFSDLVIWKGQKRVGKYQIYVLSKKKQLETLQVADLLKKTDLRFEFENGPIIISGKVKNEADYLLLHKLIKQNKDSFIVQGGLTRKLRNHLIAKVYRSFMENNYLNISCSAHFIHIHCYLNSDIEVIKNKMLEWEDLYFIKFITMGTQNQLQNYKVKLRLVQLERLDGNEISFGLDKINSTASDIFNEGTRALIKNNLISLNQNQIKLSTLAEPETILRFNSKASIQLGADIPFSFPSQNGQVIINEQKWMFAGLKLSLELKEKSGRVYLNYETQFTSPVQDTISGSKESSSLFLSPGTPIQIFKIGLRTEGKGKSRLPVLSRIPLLGKIFESSNSQNNYKHIYGFLTLEEQ